MLTFLTELVLTIVSHFKMRCTNLLITGVDDVDDDDRFGFSSGDDDDEDEENNSGWDRFALVGGSSIFHLFVCLPFFLFRFWVFAWPPQSKC